MSDARPATQSSQPVLKLAVLALVLAMLGLPLNDIYLYALLVIVAVVVFTGEVRARAKAWLAALAIVALAIAGQVLLAPPRIDEGHNVFLPGGPGALERELPADVYRHLAQEFDREYPPGKRCDPNKTQGCWLGQGFPDRAYAYSADGIFHPSDMSRAVTAIDFSDPVWLRLSFVNDNKYNWYPQSDVQRAKRDRRLWMGLHRWQLTMPWFEMIRLPAAYIGGQLCWRGDVLWEGAGEHFSLWRGDQCRAVDPADAGRRVVGIAIKPDSLAMRLEPPFKVRLLQFAPPLLALLASIGVVLALVRIRPRRTILPFILFVLAVAVIAIDDGSFLGGVRPFDGGDDGLFYDSVGRDILQKLLAGDVTGFLIGGEKVFFYGGPGLRYFRAFEHLLFGESYLGYLSLVLLLPFAAYGLFKRFLPGAWAIALVIGFIAIPVGELFGTTFIDYAKWAARGFADPAAYIFFICGLWVLVGARPLAPAEKFLPAFFGALLLALGIAMKPLVAPAAAVFLGGVGLGALYFRQWSWLCGLCLGFLPVFSMALHNWVFGHAAVLFSANASHPLVLVMPPSAYSAAAHELVTLNFAGGKFLRALMQIPQWLSSGPAESYSIIPLSAAGVAILIYVVVRGKGMDPWLRLVGAAALAQHAVALFYVGTARYHFLTWFLTMLVVMVFVREIGFDWLARRYPVMAERIVHHPLSRRLASGLARLQKVST
jgi:hypothetical protein